MNSASRKRIVIHDDFTNIVHNTPGSEDPARLSEAARVLLGAEADLISFCAALPEKCNYWPAEIGEFWKDGDSRVAVAYRAMASAGIDPFGTVVNAVREGGAAILGKVRVNDVHHVGGDPSRMAIASRFWREHPEWWIGTVEARGGGSPVFRECDRICPSERHSLGYGRPFVMDYAVPEVRAHRLAVIREFLGRYPLDGLTLNFIRECFCVSFPERNAHLLTEFVAECRKVVEETVGGRGGQPILGAVVPWNLEYCRIIGLDVDDWIRSGLLDYISPTPNYVSCFNIPVRDWADLAAGTGCAVYPGVVGLAVSNNDVCLPQEYEPQDKGAALVRPKVTRENVRALAHGFYAEGADGVSFFNFYSEIYQNLSPLPEICLPERIAGKERRYVYMRKPLWNENDLYKLVFPPGCLGRQAVKCRLHEDLSKATAHVRFKARHLDDLGSLRVDVNGAEIPLQRLGLIPHAGEGFQYATFELGDGMIRDGDNEIGFAYRLGTPVFDRDVIVQEIEIRVVPR